MRKPILVGNWKNKPDSLLEAKAILTGLGRGARVFKRIETFIAPPETYYERVSSRVKSFARLASQGLPSVVKGTHTGSSSLEILQNFGVRMAILGHSEERALGETDQDVSRKVKIALKSGIIPLVCVGERERDQDGNHLEFIRRQVKASLEGLKRKDSLKIRIAYEPIWAIGKRARDAMKPEDLAQMVLFIRRLLTDMYGRKNAEKIAIIYGGSVEPSNAKALIETGTSGFLVGHESLEPKDFVRIAEEMVRQ